MAFPTRWFQFWWRLPQPQATSPINAQRQYQASWFWFGITDIIGRPEMQVTEATNLVGVNHGTALDLIGMQNFMSLPWTGFLSDSMGIVTEGVFSSSFGVDPVDVWPTTKPAKIWRRAAGPPRTNLGFVYLSCFPRIWSSDGNLLNGYGISQLEFLASQLFQPIVGTNGILTPCIASYSQRTLTPITSSGVYQRLALSHKRRFFPTYKPGPAFHTPRTPP